MRIKSLELENFRLFEKVSIPFVSSDSDNGNVVVFVGNNGSGKTTILEALSLSLSWLVARISRGSGGQGTGIKDLAITNKKNFSTITIDGNYKEFDFSWRIAKNLKGRKKVAESDYTRLSELAEFFREKLTEDENASLPLLAYYPVERTILDIPLKIKTKHSFGQLDGLDGSLVQGVDFRRFFEWFREREDSESELRSRHSDDVLAKLKALLSEDRELDTISREDIDNIVGKPLRDRQLDAVRNAISTFMPGFENLKIKRKPRLRMMVDKDGVPLNVEQLSQGEKSLMALVGSISSRLSMMNPILPDPLKGRGIVMVDEIDLHLHPKWQRDIIDRLRNTFPNCQFILTTHSPLVISNSPNTLTYILNNGEIERVGNLYGMDANQVLLQEMGVEIRNSEIQNKLDDLMDLIQERKFSEAKSITSELEQILPADHWELNKVKILLLRKEAQCAKNS
ncbi:putative ATP-binding protein involved in virulence [Desulfobaculum xiamenense]|uniref:Putative ATP-binding protein involved in virulence n=1 Tax=Desulfobaculum xiamenense TaxID=995050 RepID=A0A846QMN9_9BACT|nr:AAA family ATPase [Desulfobaculum xiamenense]NJB66695.1 putative ATP-binding protein involved in virulence [Desulfobaculum xiamenense]